MCWHKNAFICHWLKRVLLKSVYRKTFVLRNENLFFEHHRKIILSFFKPMCFGLSLLRQHLHERCAGTKTHSMEQYICHGLKSVLPKSVYIKTCVLRNENVVFIEVYCFFLQANAFWTGPSLSCIYMGDVLAQKCIQWNSTFAID